MNRIILLCFITFPFFGRTQQVATGTAITNVNYNDWYRGGNNGNATSPNIFGTNWNSPIYTQTNGVQRMILMGTAPATSITGSLGLGAGLILPLAKLHVQDFATTGTDAQGRMFRTDGSSTVENRWMLWTGTNTATNLERFRVATYTTNANSAYLGTVQNGWLNVRTDNVNRLKLNETYTSNATQYDIDQYTTFGNTNTTVNTSGYLLLGQNTGFQSGGGNIYDRGAYSLLHLNGGAAIQQNGYRPWMKTGITFTDNQDMAYFGLRQLGSGLDVTEIGVTWSDNTANLDGLGPDDFVFRFTGGTTNSTTILDNDYRNTEDLDGLNIARFTGTGLFALGNTFGANPIGTPPLVFVRPQSLFHMSYDRRLPFADELYGFMQITYRRPTTSVSDIIGEGQNASDGLRFGIDNEVFGAVGKEHLNGYLRWQEASSFVIQTEDDNNPSVQSNERMRITSLGALDLNYLPTQYFGHTTPTDITRISISQRGVNPLIRPKSLLHLGFDYGNQGSGIEGFRRWMDLGVLTSTSEDHVWLGLKNRLNVNAPITGSAFDSLDAVLAWGTDRIANSSGMVDNFRFIFTGNTFSGADGSPSEDYNGLEMMRMYPATVYQHYVYNATGNIIDSVQAYGRVGVGDFTVEGVNEQPTQKLDVVGNGRFRYLPDSTFMADTLVKKIVMVDESGVLRWISKDSLLGTQGLACWDLNGNGIFDILTEDNDGDNLPSAADCQGIQGLTGPQGPQGISGGVADAHNGASLSLFDNTKVAFGQDLGQPGGPAILLNTREVPMNNQNIVFTVPGSGPNPTGNNIGIGTANPTSQLHIKSFTNVGTEVPLRVDDGNNNLSVAIKDNQRIGIGTANPQASLEIKTLQGSGIAPGIVMNSESNFPSNYLSFQQNNLPKFVIGHYNDILNIGAGSQNAPDSYINMSTITQTITLGKDVLANNNVQINGNLNVSGNANVSGLFTNSDAMFKTNIEDISSPLGIINQLQARKYYFDTTNFNEFAFEEDLQYGFIAQELEQVLPDLVENRTSPVQYDSLGNQISIPYTYKSVEYQEIIPIAVGAIQELSSENDSLRNVVTNLNDRLSALENCLSALLPTLCQMNQQAIQANTPQAQEQLRKDIAVTLTNRSTIILDQNVPNPFAEQTVINFSIPETVKKAQIHFYNQEGRIIQTVDVIERGLGSITVFGADLSSGVYTYTLVADGQIVSTKKMMKM